MNSLADLTLIKCLPKNDLFYSLNEAVILQLQTKFEISEFKAFFDNSVVADLSIMVPVCYFCHVHIFTKPMKLTNCRCNLCKDYVKKHFQISKIALVALWLLRTLKKLNYIVGENLIQFAKGAFKKKILACLLSALKILAVARTAILSIKTPTPVVLFVMCLLGLSRWAM